MLYSVSAEPWKDNPEGAQEPYMRPSWYAALAEASMALLTAEAGELNT
jgi:hypothetical protein